MSASGGNVLRSTATAQLAIADSPVHEGDVVAGRYRVERVVGVGGMGIVVAGTHLDLEQRVAIKFVLPAALNNDGLRERFLREARAAAKLKSAHATKVLDVGKLPSGAPYIVMELLEGCDLAALVASNGPLPAETAADFVAQACEAVAEAHSYGIVHRDIKPQNLFLATTVGGGALVKVLDFGVSKVSVGASDNLTKSLMVMGSPLYMSPEQMRSSRDVDARTDVWALGAVLFELLSGHAPFDAESMPALCLKVASEPPSSLVRDRPDLPAGLAAVVMRCLEKNPDDRYRDAGELAAALAPYVTPASSLTIARARMAMSGLRRTRMSSDAPVVAEPRGVTRAPSAKGTRLAVIAAIAAGAFACAAMAAWAGSAWTRGHDVTRAGEGVSAAAAVAAAGAAARESEGAAVPAPSAEPSAPPPPTAIAPKQPPPKAPPTPTKPKLLDDDIPSLR